MDAHARYETAFEGVEPPFAFVDLDALETNAEDALRRARGKSIRVASKSLRCRALQERILRRDPGFRGLMTFTLPETLWLHGLGFDDLLLAYPTADRHALAELGLLEGAHRPIVMVDSPEHLDLIEEAAAPVHQPIRVCIDLDCAYWIGGGRVKIGAKRSPVHTPAEAATLAREIVRRDSFELAALMGYEAHIAGLGDDPPGPGVKGAAIRQMQKASARELAERRAAAVEAVVAVAPGPLIVNGGGTGSLETTAAEDCVTEVTVGSGFYAPALFDHYSSFDLVPAAFFALPVVRRPGPGVVTALGGGYLASGPADDLRLPVVAFPEGLELDGQEGAGEVQTPLAGEAADRMRVGDRVYMRHAKAGELCERFDRLYLVEGEKIAGEVPTYRGEGKAFL